MIKRRIEGKFNGKHYDVNVEIHESFTPSGFDHSGYHVVDVSVDGKYLPPNAKELDVEELHNFVLENI